MPVISFTKVALPYGWLGNMSPHPVTFRGWEFRTAEALFQSLRFDDDEIREAIWQKASPFAAKLVAKSHKESMVIEPLGEQDVENMAFVLWLKVRLNPELRRLLVASGDARIIEDSSRRRGGSSLFWGAARIDGNWQGQNVLGRLWMKLRSEIVAETRKEVA